MKTIITEESNGFNIIKGFGRPDIDNEATRLRVRDLLLGSPESDAIEAKANEIMPLHKKMQEAKAASRAELKKHNKTNADLKHKEFLTFEQMIKTKEAELQDLYPALFAKQEQLRISEAVYFETAPGTFIVPDALRNEAVLIMHGDAKNNIPASLPAGKSLALVDGVTLEQVDDLRGRKYFKKVSGRWESHEIALAGVAVPVGGILEDALDQAQKDEIDLQDEVDRIKLLTVGEKEAELAEKTSALVAEAAVMRSQLEIQGVTTALEDSQAWYNAELAKLTTLYA